MVFVMTACRSAKDAQGIEYRFADREEGQKLLMSNTEYFDGFTENDLQFRLQKKDVTLEEYLSFAEEQVVDFSDEYKALISDTMDLLEKTINDKGYRLPPLEEITFICTTMGEESGAGAYTHGTQIYVGEILSDLCRQNSQYKDYLRFILAHEVFHCLTRCDPDFRADMYKLINFTVQDKEYELPPSVLDYYISNPDVEHHNAYAAFDINGKPTDCFMAFVTGKHFENEGDSFFDTGTAVLVPAAGTDIYYYPEDASNFNEVLGENTEYTIDPEECMADNFAYLLAYDKEGPAGEGYRTPEIIEGIREYLTGSANPDTDAGQMTVKIKSINKFGTIVLDTSFDGMNAAGIEVGDIITARVGDREYDIPVGTSYTDVKNGEMVCRFDLDDDLVVLAINYGSFADTTGAAVKEIIAEDPGYRWEQKVSEVKISLKEKEGYLEQYKARNLTRTDAREDYPDLTDSEFANFRAISVNGMKENTLYRSSTPVEPALGRNEYSMAAMEAAGIRTVINLDDSAEVMQAYSTYPGSYYSSCAIINPEMSYDFLNKEFGEKVRDSILFIIENDGPYLIHCKEGKDRTGMLCGILECFAGASADEVMNDYMVTYSNFYGVLPGSETYDIILNDNIVRVLSLLYEINNFEEADLKKEAEDYLRSVGLTDEQLDALAAKLIES